MSLGTAPATRLPGPVLAPTLAGCVGDAAAGLADLVPPRPPLRVSPSGVTFLRPFRAPARARLPFAMHRSRWDARSAPSGRAPAAVATCCRMVMAEGSPMWAFSEEQPAHVPPSAVPGPALLRKQRGCS